MLDMEQTQEVLKAYKGKRINIFTKTAYKEERLTIENKILLDFELWISIMTGEYGSSESNTPFLGHGNGITKITDMNNKVIFENEYVKNAQFENHHFDFKKTRETANKMRLECFGEGHDLK